jgi:hypothetical protein
MAQEAKTSAVKTKTSNGMLLPLATWLIMVSLAALAVMEMKPPNPVPATAPPDQFSSERALSHLSVIARSTHPLGTEANRAVRDYLVSQLSRLGLNPKVEAGVGIHTRPGRIVIGKTQNIVARLPGSQSSGAIMLTAHYDSVYGAPGAADDGAGVAAILEAVRALCQRPVLKNDLIVLFTDGEEQGLLGADSFASSNPWRKDVGLILNFEARGDQGPSLLFETSVKNAALIKAVAQSTPYPIGSSLFYALYRILPNDTDFTVFRPYKIPGLNFAFGENLEAYHSRLDTVQNLSAASLQHQGSYALSLADYFGNMDLTQLTHQSGDDVFFDWLGSAFVTYGERWVIPGEILATGLLVFAIFLSIRRSALKVKRVLLGLLPALAILISIPVALAAAAWLVSRLLAGHMIVSDSRANSYLLIGSILLGVCVGSLLLANFCKHFSVLELSTAGLILGCLLNWVLALLLPAGSYLLFWPFLFATLGLLIINLIRKGTQSAAQSLASIASMVAAILLFAPIAYLLYIFLTLQIIITLVAIGLLLGLFFIFCIPYINLGIPPDRWGTVVLILFICALIMTGIGAKLSVYTPEHPQHESIIYSFNADDHSAVWMSNDRSVDQWTSQFFHHQPTPQPMPDYFYGLQRPVLSAPAPLLDTNPPVADIKIDAGDPGFRKIQMKVRSPRNANAIILTFPETDKPVAVSFGARDVPVSQSSGPLTIVLLGMEDQSVDLDLTLKSTAGGSFWLTDRSLGLPTDTRPRPETSVAEQGSDVTLVCRKYPL